MKKKVLVLGSSGLIGHQVFNYLKLNSDFELSNISYRNKLNKDSVLIDARNETIFFNHIKKIKPNFLINCIGVLVNEAEFNPGYAIYLNSYLPHRLEKLSNEINAKLIHMSTDCVFSGTKSSPYIESDSKDGITVYAKTKGLGEINNNSHLTIRTSVVGPELNFRKEELFNWFMSNTKEVSGFSKSIWSGVSTIELAKAIKWFINNNVSGVYNLTNGETISKYDLLLLFKSHTNKVIKINKVDGINSNKSFIDTRKLIGYELPSYNQMIKEMIMEIANNPLLYKHYNF